MSKLVTETFLSAVPWAMKFFRIVGVRSYRSDIDEQVAYLSVWICRQLRVEVSCPGGLDEIEKLRWPTAGQ